MASRAILRRKKFLFDHLNIPNTTSSIRAFSSFRHGGSSSSSSPSPSPSPSPSSSSDGVVSGVLTDESLTFSARNGFLTPKSFRIQTSTWRNGESMFISPHFGYGSIRYLSTATATATAPVPEPGNEDGSDGNKVKEASPEDCDLAVEDLSKARAKAQMKRSQESQESVKKSTIQRVIVGPLQKLWAMVLGIGPALRVIASMSRKDWAVKLGHWKAEFVDTMKHYWLGLKLLWADVRISLRLSRKLANGKSLSRRERQQLTRTTADIFRLVPVAVFLIVPFMEFLLPVFLKLFPNMLPSTFQDKMKEEEAKKRRLKARIEYARFLQDTVKEMAKEVQSSRSGEIRQTAEELEEFLNKVRTGGRVSNEEILGFAKLFNDELTLDNISRPRLVNMCKYMGISPYGTDAYLRYMLRKRLNWIKNDDKMIHEEGVETLSEAELRQACRDRGILGTLSVDEMRQQLRDWLDLSLNRSLPSSLMILSRAFTVSGKTKLEEAVLSTMSSLPDEVVDTVEITLPSDDSVARTRRRLERLEQEEERIKEEELKQARLQESEISQVDVALAEMTTPTAGEAQKQAITKTFEKKDQLCRLSRALALLASASSVSSEREDFMKLVNKEIEMYNSMVDKEGTEGEEEAKQAYRAAREDSDHDAERDVGNKVTDALINRVDSMLQKLEKEIDDVDATIGNRWRILDRDFDGKVTAEELVATAAAYLKDTLDKEGIQELISSLSKDSEGKILVQDIVKLGAQTEDTHETEAERM